jgi:Tol biopolymer transport system component
MNFYKSIKNSLISTLTFIFLAGCTTDRQTENSDKYLFADEKHLKNVKMLTDSGENAEAYLSFNGQMLIYQATTKGTDCDQQYIMGIDGSHKSLVSTGKGRTTCGYFLPGDTTILYASTHIEDEKCPPPPDMSKGYVWKLYDSYNIFLTNLDGSGIKNITDSPKYDAEATVSPLGDKIVFTSMRDGDPEIYSMDLNGENQKRLTFEKGYDGGPFYSWDGKKIVFRASRPQTAEELKDYQDLVENGMVRPTTLEIYIMDTDGKNIQQITNFGKASFAPFFHPDNNRIIFSSNVQSKKRRNFDLYMIKIDGTSLERITYNETFDGFPIFSRDGKHLVFCSNRFNKKKGETNVFIAEWVD